MFHLFSSPPPPPLPWMCFIIYFLGEGKFGRVKFVLNGFIGGNKAKRDCSKQSDISYGGLVTSFGGSG